MCNKITYIKVHHNQIKNTKLKVNSIKKSNLLQPRNELMQYRQDVKIQSGTFLRLIYEWLYLLELTITVSISWTWAHLSYHGHALIIDFRYVFFVPWTWAHYGAILSYYSLCSLIVEHAYFFLVLNPEKYNSHRWLVGSSSSKMASFHLI